ncbi:hypothetical protein NHX12_006257 [Muraenolepis orangiensis]|uniref:Uncharacterized protein n=1 Tax=Muraenolepis orangiensis TaxID=630683 RepID=A0A9Q0DSX0_9TELE|nr:hypothetical protein NHX12_006257 [Muraenolepis orangiensis]
MRDGRAAAVMDEQHLGLTRLEIGDVVTRRSFILFNVTHSACGDDDAETEREMKIDRGEIERVPREWKEMERDQMGVGKMGIREEEEEEEEAVVCFSFGSRVSLSPR